MSERGTNLAFIAIFSVLGVLFVAAALCVCVAVFASDSGISRNALPASSYSLRHDH
ncbi:MAG TPA: hypothetical protein VGC32_17820 [Solirubrobacterales bacterium]